MNDFITQSFPIVFAFGLLFAVLAIFIAMTSKKSKPARRKIYENTTRLS